MYNYIKGIVTEKGVSDITIEVGGLGYEVFVTKFTMNELKTNEVQKVFTYVQVREDGTSIFGFAKKEEKALFTKLITVSGIGPKSAISIMSSESIEKLAYFIASSDVAALSKLKGIGKKTAERIIVELKDKVSGGNEKLPDTPVFAMTNTSNDAVTGLLSLGFSRAEAEGAVQQAITAGASELEDIISKAIKLML